MSALGFKAMIYPLIYVIRRLHAMDSPDSSLERHSLTCMAAHPLTHLLYCYVCITYHVALNAVDPLVETLVSHPLDRQRAVLVSLLVVICLVDVSRQTEVRNLNHHLLVNPDHKEKPVISHEIFKCKYTGLLRCCLYGIGCRDVCFLHESEMDRRIFSHHSETWNCRNP